MTNRERITASMSNCLDYALERLPCYFDLLMSCPEHHDCDRCKEEWFNAEWKDTKPNDKVEVNEKKADYYKWHDMTGTEKEYPVQWRDIMYCFIKKDRPEHKLYIIDTYIKPERPEADEFTDDCESGFKCIAWKYLDEFEDPKGD